MIRLLTLVVALALAGCSTVQNNSSAQLEKLSADFIAGYVRYNPGSAVQLGIHDFDGQLPIPSRAQIREHIDWARAMENRANAINSATLTKSAQIELRLLKTGIANELFPLVETESWHKNPMDYATGISVDIYVKRNFAPFDQRVRSLIGIEKRAPQFFAAARANLDDSLARPLIETAIEEAKGSADFLGKDLKLALKDLNDPALLAEFNQANDRAIAEINRYVEFLEKEKLPKAHNNYAIGREKFTKMLRDGDLIPLAPEEILEVGLKRLRLEQQQFAETAKLIDPTKRAIEVFNAIQKDHPTAEGLFPDTRKNLEAIRQFVIDHHIISMPSDVRARVEETPQFERATTFASCDSPGPFETKATEAFYYVTPTETNWPAEQKDEWLTSFNYYTTDVVSIHECYPGHYTQFLHLKASRATRLQKIVNSYAFVEGWAHYCEQMLIDQGYGSNPALDSNSPTSATDKIHAAKYKLAQLDESLLRICRLCVAIKMHCQGMTVDDATKFFIENCYYEQKPAHQEAMRGTFDPGYCSYTLGKLQFLKLRADYEQQQGKAFTLEKFHNALLSHGAPPIRLLRELLLKDPTTWDQIF
jgi:uncharacterized protein (DUF885 family)